MALKVVVTNTKYSHRTNIATTEGKAKAEWKSGRKIIKIIGCDADEEHRAKIPEDKKYIYKYPLVKWGVGRDECIKIIEVAGLGLPGKSACYFCPSSKPTEIRHFVCSCT